MRAAYRLPLAQLKSMTLSYILLSAVIYFFWWDKPKDIRTPSITDLLSMRPDEKDIFESMACSNKFNDKEIEYQATY
jgi:hypothetical protein